MTRDDRDEMASVARDVLWNWTDEAADPNPDQRGWKRARLDGILLACERTGILSTEEIARWRALAGGGEPHVPLGADPDAATRWLDQLLEAVRPMTRDQDAERIQASNRFHGALGALAEAGVITDEERSRWHERELSASAPWLPTESVEQLASGGGFYAIGVPARTPDEQAADEAARQEHERLARRGALHRVAVAERPERQNGLAVIAVLARDECTEVLFHVVGPPHGHTDGGFADLEAHHALVDALAPPVLSDDVGTAYEAASKRPVRSNGTGGTPDPERPHVVTGAWRYFPAAPEATAGFTATVDGTSWAIP
jgi:hypothetical protein